MPIVLRRKLRLRKMRYYAQGCTVDMWQSWDLNRCLSWDFQTLKDFPRRAGVPARTHFLGHLTHPWDKQRRLETFSFAPLFWGPQHTFLNEHQPLLLESPSHGLLFSKNRVRVSCFPGNVFQASFESLLGSWSMLMSEVSFSQCSCILFWNCNSFWE